VLPGKIILSLQSASFSALQAHMAVVFQPFIAGKAAGTCLSLSGPPARPVFNIESSFGCGEAVVQATTRVDRYFVGLFADVILEQQIAVKEVQLIPKKGRYRAGQPKCETIYLRPSPSVQRHAFGIFSRCHLRRTIC
jgi:hypothetical protein